MITITYVGTVVGFLILSFVGDLLGRKRLMIICMSGVVIGLVIAIFCQSLMMAGIGLFIASVGVQNAFNICFYFIAETVSEDFR
jgi:MFS family permease